LQEVLVEPVEAKRSLAGWTILRGSIPAALRLEGDAVEMQAD
jgi:hypothetical protein